MLSLDGELFALPDIDNAELRTGGGTLQVEANGSPISSVSTDSATSADSAVNQKFSFAVSDAKLFYNQFSFFDSSDCFRNTEQQSHFLSLSLVSEHILQKLPLIM